MVQSLFNVCMDSSEGAWTEHGRSLLSLSPALGKGCRALVSRRLSVCAVSRLIRVLSVSLCMGDF